MAESSRFPDHIPEPPVICPPTQSSSEKPTHDSLTNKPLIYVNTDTDSFVLRGNACELSSYSFIPTTRDALPKERTVFNSDAKNRPTKSNYDRTFHVNYDYDQQSHRCDRVHPHSRGLEVNKEEKEKIVPTLANSIYGHYLNRRSEPEERSKHGRVQHVQADFYRRQGVLLKVLETPKDY